jgi:HlyD family secretion protein
MKRKIIVAGAAVTVSLIAGLRLTVDQWEIWQAGPAFAAPAVQARFIAAGGCVEPASEARELAATVVGRLTMTVGEGDHVSAGDLIAEIENEDLKAQLSAAEATGHARANELARLKAGARVQEIAEAKAAVREAEAVAANARTIAERQSALGLKQIVSQEAVERAQSERDAALARRDLLAERLALLVAPPRYEDVGIAQANVDKAKEDVRAIKAAIEKTLIRSPIDGAVLKLSRRTGETVTYLPPTLIATVGDTRRLRVVADVDQAEWPRITPGMTAWVTADAFSNTRFRGTVARRGEQAGTKKCVSDNPEERLDTKTVEVLIDLEPGVQLPIKSRVDIRIEESPKNERLSDASEPPRLRGEATAFKGTRNR